MLKIKSNILDSRLIQLKSTILFLYETSYLKQSSRHNICGTIFCFIKKSDYENKIAQVLPIYFIGDPYDYRL